MIFLILDCAQFAMRMPAAKRAARTPVKFMVPKAPVEGKVEGSPAWVIGTQMEVAPLFEPEPDGEGADLT